MRRFGRTNVVYCAANLGESLATVAPEAALARVDVTDAQRRLVSLCRSFKGSDPFAAPATNRQIAVARQRRRFENRTCVPRSPVRMQTWSIW